MKKNLPAMTFVLAVGVFGFSVPSFAGRVEGRTFFAAEKVYEPGLSNLIKFSPAGAYMVACGNCAVQTPKELSAVPEMVHAFKQDSAARVFPEGVVLRGAEDTPSSSEDVGVKRISLELKPSVPRISVRTEGFVPLTVVFEAGKSRLSGESQTNLLRMPVGSYTVVGYADGKGSSKAVGKKLARARAGAVASFLRKHGYSVVIVKSGTRADKRAVVVVQKQAGKKEKK